MGKVVNSGLHTLKNVFGESVFDYSQELQRLRHQSPFMHHHYESTRRAHWWRDSFWKLLCAAGWIMCVGVLSIWHESPTNGEVSGVSATRVIILVIGIGIAAFSSVNIAQVSRETEKLGKESSQFDSQLRQHKEQYGESVIQRLEHLATNRGQVLRRARRGDSTWLLYCPSYLAMLDIETEEMMLLNVGDCRDVQLCTRETERRYSSSGVVQSAARNALGGAAAGAILFGDAGMIAGSVIGAAGERKVSFQTIEQRVAEYVVDLYTRLQQYPVITLQFGTDDSAAKEFYGLISASIPGSV